MLQDHCYSTSKDDARGRELLEVGFSQEDINNNNHCHALDKTKRYLMDIAPWSAFAKTTSKGYLPAFPGQLFRRIPLYIIIGDLELAPPFLGIGEESTVCCCY